MAAQQSLSTPTSTIGGSSLDVNNNFSKGNRLFTTTRTDLSIPVGEEVEIPRILNMKQYSKYYLFYITDQDTLVTVDWFNSSNRGYVREKVVTVPASAPDGTFLEGRVQGQNVRISFINNAVAGPGSDLTQIYATIYAIR